MAKLFESRPLLLLFTVILALAVRWYKIDNAVADWHSWRQADTASVSDFYFKNGINLLYPRYHDISAVPSGKPNPQGYRMVEFPLYNALHATVAKALPFWPLDQWGRALSVFISLFSLVFLYLILDRLSGPFTAHVGALFMAILPFNIYYSRVILPEPLMLALFLGSIYFFLKLISQSRPKYFLLSAGLLSLAILVKPYALFFSLPLLHFAILRWGRLHKNKYFYLYLSLILLPFLVWRLWISQFPEGIPATSWLFNVNGIRFRPAWFRWLFGVRLAHLILGMWGVILLAFGLFTKPTKKENYCYHLWFLGILVYFSLLAGGNVRHDYYQAITIPFLIAILAKGITVMLTPSEHLWPITPILAVFSFSMMLFLSWYEIRGYYQINNNSIVIAGEAANKLLPKDAKVVAPYNADTAFLYQIKRQGWPIILTSAEDVIKEGATHYVSVTYDKFTTELMTKPFVTILEQNPLYVILELHKP